MPEVVVATPLTDSLISRPHYFAEGISIRQISSIRWDSVIVRDAFSNDEIQLLSDAQYWLCVSKEYEGVVDDGRHELDDAAHQAAIALQIICPNGAPHKFLKLRRTPEGWDIMGILPRKQLWPTTLGRMTDLEDQRIEDFDSIYAGIRWSFTKKIIRLQNPVLLLEHGQQLDNPYLSALLFVTALDMLFMAGEISRFVPRLGGFLGADSQIFPAWGAPIAHQPNVTVREVISDLYEFRNIIAHGQEIPKRPYLEAYNLISTAGCQINQVPFYYANLMAESGLFLLTAALRKVFTERLFEVVSDTEKWRLNMKVYERRYSGSSGPRPVKSRGR